MGKKVSEAPQAPQPTPTPATPPAEDKFVTKEALQDFQQQMAAQQQQLMQSFATTLGDALGQRMQPPAAAPQLPMPPTEEEWEAAYENGDPKLLRKLQKQEAAAMQAAFDAKLSAIEQYGNQRLETLAGRIGTGDMPYYDLVKDDVEAQMARLAPHLRTDPDTRKTVYDAMVGKNISKVLAHVSEQASRQEEGDLLPAGMGHGGQRRLAQAPEADPIEERLNDPKFKQTLARLGYKGEGAADQFALRITQGRCKTFKEYAEQTAGKASQH